MILSGAYAVWYARWELAVYRGDLSSDAVVDVGERWRLAVVTWLEQVGALELTLFIVVVVAVATLIAQLRAGRRTPAETVTEARAGDR